MGNIEGLGGPGGPHMRWFAGKYTTFMRNGVHQGGQGGCQTAYSRDQLFPGHTARYIRTRLLIYLRHCGTHFGGFDFDHFTAFQQKVNIQSYLMVSVVYKSLRVR